MFQPLGHWTVKIYAPDQISFNKVSIAIFFSSLALPILVKATSKRAKSKLQRQALCVKEQKDCPWAHANTCGSIHLPSLHVKEVLGVSGVTMDSSAMPGLASTEAGL